MSRLGENVVEEAAIEYFAGAGAGLAGLGYVYAHGPTLDAERGGATGVVLEGRLRDALARINPRLPPDALDQAARAVLHPASPAFEENNVAFTRWLAAGYPVEVRRADGALRGDAVALLDYDHPENNDWLVVNQLTLHETVHNRNERRPDLVVFVNGLPLAVFELKDPTAEDATLEKAWRQLQTYKAQTPSLFHTNAVLVVADGLQARFGSLTAPLERFGPWRTDDEGQGVPAATPELQTLVEGLFPKRRLLDYLRHFQLWEQDADTGRLTKKIAGYHQVRAVDEAVEAVVRAAGFDGDRRAGVVWHTQGSGKSVSLAFLAARLLQHPALDNPTLVVLTDRNDLDDQLLAQFAAARDLLPKPVQAESREHLRELLSGAGGGLVFTTIQKFGMPAGEAMPALSARRNVVVLADEAHRSHYEFVQGLARNLRGALPAATFAGFTGTPVELENRSTLDVFGGYIDTYTISESVHDGATVPIYYESRLATIDLPDDEKPRLDEAFEEVTEDQETTDVAHLQRPWKRLESIVGLKKRLKLIAEDIVEHYERRTEALEGKAMVVCMSRKIASDLYREIVRLRPHWHAEKDEEGQVKVVITGAATDTEDLVAHVRSGPRRKLIEKRFKEPVDLAVAEGRDPLRLVLVRDMWLTGFDVPSLHTLYVDKPMQGHTLMQAIARVNRVFRDKPSGLVVDYIGLAEHLRTAVATYGGKRDRPAIPVEDALALLRTEAGVVRDLFFGFDYAPYLTAGHAARLQTLKGAVDHVLGLPPTSEGDRTYAGAERYGRAMGRLNKAVALAIHLEGARDLRDEVAFFQHVQRTLRKPTPGGVGKRPGLDLAIRQIVSGAVAADGVVDLFEAAGLPKPDLSILSDEFLQRVGAVPQEHLRVELLRRLVAGEVRSQRRQNVVQADRFSSMLEETLAKYRNRAVETTEVVAELIQMAKELRDAPRRGDALGLSTEELAFYDALIAQEGVQGVMEDAALSEIARALAQTVRDSATLDWRRKESVRAQMRARIRRLLRRYGYPPEQQEGATDTVIRQAEVLGNGWAGSDAVAP